MALCLASALAAQQPAASSPAAAVQLYRALLAPGFDTADVHHIRDVLFNVEDVQISLIDGTIGLMRAVDGHVTGAVFEGEGEVLLFAPDRAERTSLALFTKTGVLDQKFGTAYFRFADDKLLREFQAGFRPASDTEAFVQKWTQSARILGVADALQLLQAITNSGSEARYFHARFAQTAAGSFDVFYDSTLPEQIYVAQLADEAGRTYLDTWASFQSQSARSRSSSLEGPVEVSDYKIHAQISPPTDLAAKAELTLLPRRTGLRTILLELSRYLKVSSVSANGEPVEFIQNEALSGSSLERQGNDTIAIVMPSALEKDRPVQLSIEYAGPVMFDTGGDLIYVGARGMWYPNPGPAFANFDLTFDYPSEWTLVATGRQLSSGLKGSTSTTHFASEKSIARAGFNLGRFEAASAVDGGTKIQAYAARHVEQRIALAEARVGLSPDPAKQVQRIASQGAAAVQFLSGELDPFPYSNLQITQIPAFISQSWPGLIYLSSTAFLDREERAALGQQDPFQELVMSDLMLDHEVAHQWWGDAVDCVSYRDTWMIEALANYSALLMVEKQHPGSMRIALDQYRKELLRETPNGIIGEAGPVTLGARVASSKFPGAYEPVIYGRGTWLIHMLRSMYRQAGGKQSDAMFFAALKSLLAEAPRKKISTADLQHVFEQSLPPSLFYEKRRSLDWFFDSWINGAAIPEFDLEDLHITPRGQVTGAIVQKNAAKDQITAVPLYAADADGNRSFLSFVFVDDKRVAFRFTAPAGTKDILLDPENTILRR